MQIHLQLMHFTLASSMHSVVVAVVISVDVIKQGFCLPFCVLD